MFVAARAGAERSREQPTGRESRSLGLPWDGRLVRGVQLPAQGDRFFTWDPVLKRVPDRGWRRYGSDRLVRTLRGVLAGYAAAHPEAPRVGIGDLSRRDGGDFGPRYGPPGHASHQNGLDLDVYYPRRDGRERAPVRPEQIERPLAQDLLDRFLAAGAAKIFVGPHTDLTGPPAIVEVLPAYHDNHMHVRLAGDGARAFLVGRSTRGMPIRAFSLGTGRPNVLVVGCIHGDECAGSVVVSRAVQSRPPTRGTLWLVPDLNPDGHALARRGNANRVDLNRNFPGSWRSSPRSSRTWSGPAPASERETRVAMRLIRRLRPEVTVWFHQPEALVRATGSTAAVARRFAAQVGLPFRELPRPPGSATDWQERALRGTHAFVVELPAGGLDIRASGRYVIAIRSLLAGIGGEP
jgi:zinc carboxypeptidase/penicillin-insensitive murein endopeptidase